MTGSLAHQAVRLLLAVLLVGSSVTASPNAPDLHQNQTPTVAAHTPDVSVDYMPLTEGRRLTYVTQGGARFTLTFGASTTVRWFDGTDRQVVPVTDTRCDCQVLYGNAAGEIRAVGSIEQGRLHAWGEYIPIWTGKANGRTETLVTPAGRFEGVVRVADPEGSIWFAPEVGIVKAADYELSAIEGPYASENGRDAS